MELEFTIDTSLLELDESIPLADMLEFEVDFPETLDMEMEISEGGGGVTLAQVTQKIIANNAIAKTPTGFISPEDVVIRYNKTDRTITIVSCSGAYYNGALIPELVDGWTSEPHAINPTANLFLYYNGTSFIWNTQSWTYDQLQIALIVVKGSIRFAQRECHGMQPWECHLADHKNMGTYKDGGGDLEEYDLLSTTPTDRRPLITALLVRDEDLSTTISALESEIYQQVNLTADGAININQNAADIVPLSGSRPYYNNFDSGLGQFVQTLMSNNSYMSVFVVAFPVTSDSDSQQFRYMFFQGQSQGSLANQQALFPQNLYLGEFANLSPEFVFISKIIIRYTASNWYIAEVYNLTGTRAQTVGTIAGAYLSGVTTDETLVGNGTTTNPLGHNPIDTTITGLNSVTNGGEVPDVDYNWFKSVYTALVDGSVKSWIIGIVTLLKYLTDRVLKIEDDYILRYVVPQNSALINLTLDRYGNAISIGEGEKLIIDVYCQFSTADTLVMRINDVATSNYYRGIDAVTSLTLSGSRVNIYSHVDLGVVNGNLIGSVQNSSYTTSSRQAITYQLRTLDIPLPVTSIQLFGATGVSILANSVIILKIK